MCVCVHMCGVCVCVCVCGCGRREEGNRVCLCAYVWCVYMHVCIGIVVMSRDVVREHFHNLKIAIHLQDLMYRLSSTNLRPVEV